MFLRKFISFSGFPRFFVSGISRHQFRNLKRDTSKAWRSATEVARATGKTEKFLHAEVEHFFQFIPKYEPHKFNEGLERKHLEKEFKLEEDYYEWPHEDVLETFEALCYHCMKTGLPISNETNRSFADKFSRVATRMSPEETIKAMCEFLKCPREYQFGDSYSFWSAIEDQITYWYGWRLRDDKMALKMCNLWVQLSFTASASDFMLETIQVICRKAYKVPAPMLVETMFYLTVLHRKYTNYDWMRRVEARFNLVFDELNINEIGIVCSAFVKNEIPFYNPQLVKNIYEKTISEIDTIHEITLANILRVLRISSTHPHAAQMKALGDALLPLLPNYSLITCLQILRLGTRLQHLNQPLVEEIVHRFSEEIKTVPLKEFQRIALALSIFNFRTESGIEKKLFAKMQSEIKLRFDDLKLPPKYFVQTVYHLILCGSYDPEVIKLVFKPKFLYRVKDFECRRTRSVKHELLGIDSFTRINIPTEYSGKRLSASKLSSLGKHRDYTIPLKVNKHTLKDLRAFPAEVMMLDLKEFMENLFGPNKLCKVLPHHLQPVIVYCFSETGESMTNIIGNSFSPQGQIFSMDYLMKKNPDANLERCTMVAVITGGWKFYLNDGVTPTAELQMQLLQLQMIGYKTIVIEWRRWRMLSSEEKEELLRSEVRKALVSSLISSLISSWSFNSRSLLLE